MVNLDIHIVGVGNLGSSLATGLNNINEDFNVHLYDQKPEFSPMKNSIIKNEIDFISDGVLVLCIKPKDIKQFGEASASLMSSLLVFKLRTSQIFILPLPLDDTKLFPPFGENSTSHI